MYFYLHCGPGFNFLHGGRTKRCFICFLCVVFDKRIFFFFLCHVTLKTLELHGPRYTRGGAYAVPPLGLIVDTPVFIVTRVESYDVGRYLGWSSNRHGWSWLMSSLCQYLSHKGELKISV
jgi:hypothetical protein